MAQDRSVGATAVPTPTRVLIFRPLICVTLEAAPGVGTEEATTVAIASWSAALSGTDDVGDPDVAPWWQDDLHEIATVVSVELQGVTWAAETSGNRS